MGREARRGAGRGEVAQEARPGLTLETRIQTCDAQHKTQPGNLEAELLSLASLGGWSPSHEKAWEPFSGEPCHAVGGTLHTVGLLRRDGELIPWPHSTSGKAEAGGRWALRVPPHLLFQGLIATTAPRSGRKESKQGHLRPEMQSTGSQVTPNPSSRALMLYKGLSPSSPHSASHRACIIVRIL